MKTKRNEKRNKKEKRKNYTRETKKEGKKTSIPIAFVSSEFTQSHDGPCAAMFFLF